MRDQVERRTDKTEERRKGEKRPECCDCGHCTTASEDGRARMKGTGYFRRDCGRARKKRSRARPRSGARDCGHGERKTKRQVRGLA